MADAGGKRNYGGRKGMESRVHFKKSIAIVDQKKYKVGCCFWFGVFFKYLC